MHCARTRGLSHSLHEFHARTIAALPGFHHFLFSSSSSCSCSSIGANRIPSECHVTTTDANAASPNILILFESATACFRGGGERGACWCAWCARTQNRSPWANGKYRAVSRGCNGNEMIARFYDRREGSSKRLSYLLGFKTDRV